MIRHVSLEPAFCTYQSRVLAMQVAAQLQQQWCRCMLQNVMQQRDPSTFACHWLLITEAVNRETMLDQMCYKGHIQQLYYNGLYRYEMQSQRLFNKMALTHGLKKPDKIAA